MGSLTGCGHLDLVRHLRKPTIFLNISGNIACRPAKIDLPIQVVTRIRFWLNLWRIESATAGSIQSIATQHS